MRSREIHTCGCIVGGQECRGRQVWQYLCGHMEPDRIIAQVIALRKQQKVSLRELARKADLAPASLSAIENGQSSPTLATVHKLLKALGTDFAGLVATLEKPVAQSPVFAGASMPVLSDRLRRYSLVLPRRAEIPMQIIDETIERTDRDSDWEVHEFDLAGYLIKGGPLTLEIEGQGTWRIQVGDAFHVRRGLRHRASNAGGTAARLLCVTVPAEY